MGDSISDTDKSAFSYDESIIFVGGVIGAFVLAGILMLCYSSYCASKASREIDHAQTEISDPQVSPHSINK